MIQQTDRKAPDRLNRPEQQKSHDRLDRRSDRQSAQDTLALSALLQGVSPEQLPLRQMQALSGRIGNSAMLELIAHRSVRPDAAARTLPAGEPVTQSAEWSGADASFEAAPEFSSLPPLTAGGAWTV